MYTATSDDLTKCWLYSASTKEMLVGTFLIQFVRRAFLVCFLRLYEWVSRHRRSTLATALIVIRIINSPLQRCATSHFVTSAAAVRLFRTPLRAGTDGTVILCAAWSNEASRIALLGRRKQAIHTVSHSAACVALHVKILQCFALYVPFVWQTGSNLCTIAYLLTRSYFGVLYF